MAYTIAVDFGSTYTKMAVFDLANGEKVMTTRHASTVATDASIALKANLSKAEKIIGIDGVKNAHMLASSSAAGGLRMVVVGLTRRYSFLAGANAALGAGARVIGSYWGRLKTEELEEIREINPEILLLCGGVEGGNSQWLMENARKLAGLPGFTSPVVYAGNQETAAEVRSMFLMRQKECYTVENVFPSFGELCTEPAGEAIRNIFMRRITGMKGLGKVRSMVGDVLMPTPAAVLRGGALLAEGLDGEGGLGECMLFDVGGATTDVYSFTKNRAGDHKIVGAPEPEHKRTVEGDLGLRSSALSLLKTADLTGLPEGLSEEMLKEKCFFRTEHSDYIPDGREEKTVDGFLAEQAVYTGARRHCGQILNYYSKEEREIREGKDLTNVIHIVGTGGPIINNEDPKAVMEYALQRKNEPEKLLPGQAEFYLDSAYLLFAVGLACEENPGGALEIARKNIIRI